MLNNVFSKVFHKKECPSDLQIRKLARKLISLHCENTDGGDCFGSSYVNGVLVPPYIELDLLKLTRGLCFVYRGSDGSFFIIPENPPLLVKSLNLALILVRRRRRISSANKQKKLINDLLGFNGNE